MKDGRQTLMSQRESFIVSRAARYIYLLGAHWEYLLALERIDCNDDRLQCWQDRGAQYGDDAV